MNEGQTNEIVVKASNEIAGVSKVRSRTGASFSDLSLALTYARQAPRQKPSVGEDEIVLYPVFDNDATELVEINMAAGPSLDLVVRAKALSEAAEQVARMEKAKDTIARASRDKRFKKATKDQAQKSAFLAGNKLRSVAASLNDSDNISDDVDPREVKDQELEVAEGLIEAGSHKLRAIADRALKNLQK